MLSARGCERASAPPAVQGDIFPQYVPENEVPTTTFTPPSLTNTIPAPMYLRPEPRIDWYAVAPWLIFVAALAFVCALVWYRSKGQRLFGVAILLFVLMGVIPPWIDASYAPSWMSNGSDAAHKTRTSNSGAWLCDLASAPPGACKFQLTPAQPTSVSLQHCAPPLVSERWRC